MNQLREKDIGTSKSGGRFTRQLRTEASGAILGPSTPEPTIRSRRMLVEVAGILSDFNEALTIVGAHAVMIHAEAIGYQSDSTADADTVFNPRLMATSPRITELMAQAGLEPVRTDRPGIYGYAADKDIKQRQTTTIDLIVPDLYAGAGRRSAVVEGHKGALTRAPGLELAPFDRDLRVVSTMPGDGDPIEASVYVAGVGALLVAKAHKVHDRLQSVESHPHRLRPKDSKDIGLLMLSSDPLEVSERVRQVTIEHPETADIAKAGFEFVLSQYGQEAGRSIVSDHLSDSIRDLPDGENIVAGWIDEFSGSKWWQEQSQS